MRADQGESIASSFKRFLCVFGSLALQRRETMIADEMKKRTYKFRHQVG